MALTQVKEVAYLEYIKRTQPQFDTLTIDNCHDYLACNQLDFVQISHSEFCKSPTKFRDITELRIHFDFRRSCNGINLSLYKKAGGYFMNVGRHMSAQGYIGTYVISENHFRILMLLAGDNSYEENVQDLLDDTIDFAEFSMRLDEATLRVNSELPVTEFFRKYFGLDDTFIQHIITNYYFWR